jgi:hypothetical protein
MAEEKSPWRRSGTLGAVAFGITLAVIIGLKLDRAALAVMVGVGCGVGASIPASLLIFSILRRQERKESRQARRTRHRRREAPPVVVVAPPSLPQFSDSSWSGRPSAPEAASRRFAVIGEEDLKDDYEHW